MIGKIQDYKLKEVKVKKDEATVTFTSLSVSFHGAEAAVRTILMSPYGINIDKLKYWNQSDKSNDEKGKGKDLTTKNYKELVEDLVDHAESENKVVYAERIHKDLSDYQPEDSSDSSNKLSGKDK